ncbi:hypothetical protein VTL71DRAFT_15594 [Oculimacula yallundae]|uniref:RGS domain-containing protein n=1 Tax=Oculimacula yallundae TaxID=86028 RepID=A0ABR4CJ48_9HELO
MFPSRIKSVSTSSGDSDVVVDIELEERYQASKRRRHDPPAGIAPNSKPHEKISMMNTLKNVFLFRKPGYTPSPEALKDFQDEMERRLNLKSSSGEGNGMGRTANCYKMISIHPNSIPEDISFDKMMMCATFPPINMTGFKAFLTNIDYNAENLDFLLYVQHYANLFSAVAEDERSALSPPWTKDDEENAKKTIMGVNKTSHKANPSVPQAQPIMPTLPGSSGDEADTRDIKDGEEDTAPPKLSSGGEADIQDANEDEGHSVSACISDGEVNVQDTKDDQEYSTHLGSSVDQATTEESMDDGEHTAWKTGGEASVQDMKDDNVHSTPLGSSRDEAKIRNSEDDDEEHSTSTGTAGDEAGIQNAKDDEEHSTSLGSAGEEADIRDRKVDEEHSTPCETSGGEEGNLPMDCEEHSTLPGTSDESKNFSMGRSFSNAEMDAIAPFAKHYSLESGTQSMKYNEQQSSPPDTSDGSRLFSMGRTFSDADMDAIAPFVKHNSLVMSTEAPTEVPVENTTPIGPELPISVMNLWKESERIAKAFILTDGPKQLNLSSKERELVLFALQRSNHPSSFAVALRAADQVLRNDSYPKFLQLATPNMNRIRQKFAYTMGYLCITLGIFYASIMSLTRARREWRLFGVPLVVLGVATLFAARRGMCLVLHSFGHYQVKPWEVHDPEHAERAHANPEVFLGGKYNSESSDWVHRYNRRYAMRKIFDKEAPVEEPRIRDAQNVIFGQGLFTGFLGSVVIMAIFMSLPPGNDF